MRNIRPLSPELLQLLRTTDTCTVSNAIETFDLRLRNEGYIHRDPQRAISCMFPALSPVAGYAVTARIRTASPPSTGRCYYQRSDWWEHLAAFPSPKIMVFEDIDHVPGAGAFVGEIHAEIAAALGCVACVSSGTVRDLPALERKGFQCFARGASVSHAYAHIVEFGGPVEIGSLKISPGDLLHGDWHGVQTIPFEIAGELHEAVDAVRQRESELIGLCRSKDFSLDKLTALLGGNGPR